MILLILLKGILSFKIFEAQRTLIQMLLQCLIGMIPFLTIMFLSVLTFALVNLSLDRQDGYKAYPGDYI